MRYIPEPFKIKMVETIKILTEEERKEKIKEAFYNVFYLNSEDVYIDLLTDSGTGAMSDQQWAAMITGDEAYAGARGYKKVVAAVKNIFGYNFAQPVHQGRAAEQVLFPCIIKPGQKVISNMHFDTTRAHVELCKGEAIDIVCKEAMDISSYADFKGNMDTIGLREFILKTGKENVAMIIMTLTNNSAGGQPVSIENIKETKKIADEFGITMIIDGARYAENAYFIKQREEAYKESSIEEIVKIMFSYADAFTMSCKKDAIVNMGGLIGIREDEELYGKVKNFTVPYEGFISYGGLAGRDLEALAIGLYEGINYDFLKYRIGQIEYLGEKLKENGIPFQYPVGGHAIFLNAKAMLPHIPYCEFPAQVLCLELYKEGGIRACDIGSFLIGVDPITRKQIQSTFEFTRLAIPRRVYTQSHLDYIVDCLVEIKARAASLKGYKITWEPEVLRHFTAKLEPLDL